MTAEVRIIDRSAMTERMNQALVIDPARTALVTVDCHRGHLDPAVATMPVAAERAAAVVAATARVLRLARERGMPVIHVILTNRILPDGKAETTRNPFMRTVESIQQSLTPDLPSTISGHNLVGSIQTQLMPELGPEPTDILLTTKRRLSIYRDTDLDITLRELDIEAVVLVGINTNTCVLNAAFETTNRDLKTIVVSDCVHSMYGDDLHEFGLQNVARCLGWVLTVDEFTAKIAGAPVNQAALAAGAVG
jgi:nicotinamidase-related amidase